MVAECSVEYTLHGGMYRIEKVLPVFTRVPAFQFRQNIATITPHYKVVSPRKLPGEFSAQ
jgi:hypothetical protein